MPMPRVSNARSDTRTAFCPSVLQRPFLGNLLPLFDYRSGMANTWAQPALLGGYLPLYHQTRRYYTVQRGWPRANARLYAFWIVLAKFPQA